MRHPTHTIDDVLRWYRVSEAHTLEVIRFLSAQPGLVPVLLKAVKPLEEVFGQATLCLEVEKDPEGGARELFCVVLVATEPENALRLLTKFDETWFSKTPKYVRRHLNFTVDTEEDDQRL